MGLSFSKKMLWKARNNQLRIPSRCIWTTWIIICLLLNVRTYGYWLTLEFSFYLITIWTENPNLTVLVIRQPSKTKQNKSRLWFFQTFTSDLWTEGKIAVFSNNLAPTSLPLRSSFTAGKQITPLQQCFSEELLLCLFWMRDGILNMSGLDSAPFWNLIKT